MLDQHVAVTIGQDVCNLTVPPTGCENHRVQTLNQYLVAYLAACLVTKNSSEAKPLSCEHLVGVRRFELLTSSVSGKRSPPELNAQMERTTGLEPATPTLARLCSTN